MQLMKSNVELASDSIVDRVYEQLKAMAVSYEFKPGERLNEGELAKRLGVSRTPLREALNRLNTEGFLRFTPGKGFFCRELDAHEIFDLYELRKSLEIASVRLAITRARDEDIDALLAFLSATGPDPGERSSVELVELDETFHGQQQAEDRRRLDARRLRRADRRALFRCRRIRRPADPAEVEECRAHLAGGILGQSDPGREGAQPDQRRGQPLDQTAGALIRLARAVGEHRAAVLVDDFEIETLLGLLEHAQTTT